MVQASHKCSQTLLYEGQAYSQHVLKALGYSQSHFHAVQWCADSLSKNGFTELKETGKWHLEGGKGYFFKRNGSTICAFLAGAHCGKHPVSAFKIVGCHTDSPCLKIAPRSKLSAIGYNQVNVMTYGGGLWRTWFDRDLTLAGKVVIQNEEGKLESRLWSCAHALLKIPHLAIHLDREESFNPNKETHLKPILASGIVDQIFGENVKKIEDDKFQLDEKHFGTLTTLIANDLKVERDRIIDFELSVADVQPPGLWGLHQEFISSPRLDNLGSSFVALDSIIDHSKIDIKQREHSEIDMILLFDHEEIGSQSA